ncbi:MAG: hypothetical protein RLZZ277_1019, partial [Actinomycetota bacterium]
MGLEDVYIRNLEHKAHRAGWLRAAVLGVNDGLVSTASLMVGVAAASASLDNAKSIIISTGAAGIAAGALSMAVGEYISVSSQTDIEESDRLLEIEHLAIDPEGELEELVAIYKERGLDEPLARAVATQLTEKDALNAHLRDELGHHPHSKARPVQESIASALSFAIGGFIPFLAAFAPTIGTISASIVGLTIVVLIVAGAIGAKTAGSKLLIPTL